MKMTLNEYIEYLYQVQIAQSELDSTCYVFSDVSILGNYWKLSLYHSTGEKMKDTPFYTKDFDTATQLFNHMKTLSFGAAIANREDEEVYT